MDKLKITQHIVGSTTKLGVETSDLDVRGFYTDPDFFNPVKSPSKFEWRNKQKIGSRIFDFDCWEIKYAIRQILKGHNSCPILLTSLWSPIYQTTSLGQKLIDNKGKLLNNNLISGTLKFCDRKAKTKGEHKTSKYLYYACSDLLEMQELLTKGDIKYPLNLPKEVLDMRQAEFSDIQFYFDLRSQFLQIETNYTPDIAWISNYLRECYAH